MSRIYEALKRIATEKQASSAGTPAPPLAPASDHAASRSLDILRSPGTGAPANVAPAPAFPELRKQFAQPGWSLAASGNVFASPSLCAEQFRKLRSHLYRLRSREPIRAVQITSALP
ncbi:MAG TPA: hypothetical protein VE825_01100, partial [Terriglobales bacterium]|nr:hypothetical protein [Terriglobales bacterium]